MPERTNFKNVIPGYTLGKCQSSKDRDGDCSHEIKRCLLLGRKAMTNLDSKLKNRTKVHLVKAMVFPVVMYGCELDYKES